MRARSRKISRSVAIIATAIGVLAAPAAAQTTRVQPGPPRFAVTYDPAITPSYSGRVYVMLSLREAGEPRLGPFWFAPEPFYAIDVVDWKPEAPLVIEDTALGFPGRLSEIEAGTYTIQAVMRRNLDSPTIGRGPGTAYGPTLRKHIDSNAGEIVLRIDRLVDARPFRETDRIKLVELDSALLGEFHGRRITMRAAVILPPDYEDNPGIRYPALYWIGGFGSTHRIAGRLSRRWDATGHADRIVRVVLDPSCYSGHHVFADSDNNGPRGAALVTELIPHLERRFRLVAAPTARFLSGHSSGGWSSLWLGVTYPDFFGGVWSLAPDPVDFRDFQRINLYEPGANMFTDPQGNRRPVARRGEERLFYEPFTRMELAYGDGGQLRSFDWVFSPRGAEGRPLRLYDPVTGDVNGFVARAWKRYDIRLILQRHWPTLGPKLKGKLSIFAGGLDTFYLEGAVAKLRTTLQKLGADATIEIFAGADHSSFYTPQLRERIDAELLAIFDRHHRGTSTRPQQR